MSQATLMRSHKEVEKHCMRLALDKAMKINARFKRKMSPGQLALDGPLQRVMTAGNFLFAIGSGRCWRGTALRLLDRSPEQLRRFGKLLIENQQIFEAAMQRSRGAGHLAPENSIVGAELSFSRH